MSKKIYVGNLPFSATDDEVRRLFGEYGNVESVKLVTDKEGRPRGFGFVELSEGADEAVEALAGDPPILTQQKVLTKTHLERVERLSRLALEMRREIAELSEELKRFEGEEANSPDVSSDRSNSEAVASLRRVQSLFELKFADLGRLFGVSRQAASSWLAHGVPPAQKPKLFTVLNIAELLERKLKPGRLPAAARRSAPSYDGLSVLQMIEADRHEELLQSVRESFDWTATA